MMPEKLKRGDEIRVIAPSRSMGLISEESKRVAIRRLEELGLKVTFSDHVDEMNEFSSSKISSRVEDLHMAFSDKNVKAILTVIGGFNSNQILEYLDYKLIKSNPKILCGYSDITALSNAIFAKTGVVTYSGPNFSSFGMLKGFEYSLEYFKRCLFEKGPITVRPSEEWSDDEWYKDQNDREFIKNTGHFLINKGEAEGTIIGANLVTFQHLAGTPFMPSFKNSIVFVEDDYEERPHHFDSTLIALSLLPQFSEVRGVVIGRFQRESGIERETLTKTIKTNKKFDDIPVIAGVDFGHTAPQITFPIGGKARLVAERDNLELEILEH
ncbi:peptidase S66 [Candidatus Micrarchaeota archaeon RBG_16_49_10]|nr:MAG: peptidase S66 [Candidatus Micrarchaeota archaeon RBG_16_49_10]